MKAIVTDDSAAMRRIIQVALQSAGWQVFTARNGREALSILDQETGCDLLLTDWHMPEMDGLQLVRALRSDHKYDGIRIVMVTSENALNMVDSALQAGANDFLMKPFSTEALCDRISEVMGG